MKSALFKIVLSMTIILFSGLFIEGCEKNKPDNIGVVTDVDFTPCGGNNVEKIYEKNRFDSVIVNVSNGIVNVEHYNFPVTCGVDTVNVSVTKYRNSDTIVVMENPYPIIYDGGNCICIISNCFQIRDIKRGNYVLVLKVNPDDVVYCQSITI